MLENGKILDGRYFIREKIGSGGFGAVYLADDTRFSGNNHVAIKQIESSNETVAKSSKIEADLLYNLSHPNLPKVTNCFQEGGANYIVMDYISGEDLAQGLLKRKKFQIAEVLRVADTVLDALEYLHSFPIYHRDVKPHNIKVDENERIFLLDFGTAKGNVEEEKTLALGGQSITGYTPFYAPLEQVLRVDPNSYLLLNSLNEEKLRDFAERKTDGRSDIYALGATLYHLLTGFSPEQATATVRAHALWSEKPDPLPNIQKINPEVSPVLAQAIHRALEVMPEYRFQTAAEFRGALKNSQMASIQTKPTEVVNFSHQPQPTQVAPTQINFQPVDTKQNQPSVTDQPLPSGFLPEIQMPAGKAKTSKLPLIGLGAMLLMVLGGLGAFLIWKFAVNKNEANTASNNQNTVSNGAKNEISRDLTYTLLVQKMRDGQKYQEPFESSGQEIFENGYQFEMSLTPSEKGFLYIFAEGINDKNEKVFNIIFPTPLRNEGSPEVSANKKFQTGWNEFGGKAGTENFWVIWNREKPDTPEKARENAFQNSGKVADAGLADKLRDFLESGKSKRSAVKDTEKKLSKIEFEGDSVVYLIQLEHR